MPTNNMCIYRGNEDYGISSSVTLPQNVVATPYGGTALYSRIFFVCDGRGCHLVQDSMDNLALLVITWMIWL